MGLPLIRPAVPSDAEPLSALVQACYRQFATTDAWPAMVAQRCAASLASTAHLRAMMGRASVSVCTVGTLVVGMVGVLEEEVTALFIAPEAQRQGHGSHLLRHALAGMQAKSLPHASVHVAARTARPFYARHGFVWVRSITITDGPCVGMTADLLHRRW